MPPAVEGEGFSCVLNASGDAGMAGDPCEYPNACDKGYVCANAGGVPNCVTLGCCSPFCAGTWLDEETFVEDDPGACEASIGAGAECVPWYPSQSEALDGLEKVGVCFAKQ